MSIECMDYHELGGHHSKQKKNITLPREHVYNEDSDDSEQPS